MKATLVTLLILVWTTSAFSFVKQHPEEYLLRNHPTYYKTKEGILKAQILDEINTNGLTESEHLLFEEETQKLSHYAMNTGDKELIYYTDFLWTFILIWRSEYDNALSLLKKIENHYVRLEDNRKLGYIYRNQGICFDGKGLRKDALHAFKKSITYFKDCNLPLEQVHGEALEANEWIYLKKFNEAQDVINRCILYMVEKKKYNTVFRYYHMLANSYSMQGLKEKEKWANLRSYEYALQSQNPVTISLAQNNLAIVNYYEGNLTEALDLFHEALKTRVKTGKKRLICESYYNIASVYEELDITKAKYFYNQSLELAKKNRLYTDECDALLALAQLSKNEKEYKSALVYLEEYIATKEKIQIEDTQEILQSANRLNKVELETFKLNLSHELLLTKRQLKKSNTWLVILSVGYAAVLLVQIKKLFLRNTGN